MKKTVMSLLCLVALSATGCSATGKGLQLTCTEFRALSSADATAVMSGPVADAAKAGKVPGSGADVVNAPGWASSAAASLRQFCGQSGNADRTIADILGVR